MRHIKLKNIAMHSRPEMVQLRSLTVSNMSGYPANPCARVILLVVTRLRERSGPKKLVSGSGSVSRTFEKERSGRSGNNGAMSGLNSVINFPKTCAGTPARRVLSSCDLTDKRI
jgi:hypothetical protein